MYSLKPMAKTPRKSRERTSPSAGRAIPKQERSRERVATILAVTARLLARSGFDALNTRRIAAAAKLPPGLLYHYFPNKGAIVMRLAEQNVQPLRQELAQMLSAAKAASWREGSAVDRQAHCSLPGRAGGNGNPAGAAERSGAQAIKREMNDRLLE